MSNIASRWPSSPPFVRPAWSGENVLLESGRDRDAVPVLLPALQVDDSYTPVVMMFLAQAYLITGDRENAREYFSQAHARALRTGSPNLLAQIERGLSQVGSTP